jgi:tetratricopeptide (TPR) repeat protein
MMNSLLKTLTLALVLALTSAPAWAQASRITGVVLDAEGLPVRGALIKFDRTDQRGAYEVKTNKKGRYVHAGLQMGTYTATLLVEDKQIEVVPGVAVSPTRESTLDFDLTPPAANAAAAAGPSEKDVAAMNAKQREEFEALQKQRAEQLARNESLNSAFNTGMEALGAKNYPAAIESLKEAAELSPTQDVIWANLGAAQIALSLAKAGDEQAALITDAAASYNKAMEIAPTKSAYPNNLGLGLMQTGSVEAGMAMLEQAVAIDPANGGQSYYNVGVILINGGDMDGALSAFRKATQIQPDYANAQFQLATALLGKAGFENGAMVPVEGTVEAYEKYLELEPTGQFAETAKAMLASLSATIDTTFKQ